MPEQYKSRGAQQRRTRPRRVSPHAGVMAKRTMRGFDEMCPTPSTRHGRACPEKIHALCLRENASQAAFARHLNVPAGLVSQWERGEKRPGEAPPSSSWR